MTKPTTTPDAVVPVRKLLRVLYADDMLQLRELFAVLLDHDGHTVETAPDGLVALGMMAADPSAYDVVITDHHMPGMNGLELVAGVRKLPYRGKIIVFSSELSEEVDSAYRRLLVDRILPKPVYPSQLRAVIDAL